MRAHLGRCGSPAGGALGILLLLGTGPAASAAHAVDAARPASPIDCTGSVRAVEDRLPQLDKLEILARLERVAGVYQAERAAQRPDAPACGRRLADLTRILGLGWYGEDLRRRSITNETIMMLDLNVELFPDDPSAGLTAFRLGQARTAGNSWAAAARAFAQAAGADRRHPTPIEWRGEKGSLASLAARNEALSLLNAADPFDAARPGHDPDPERARAITVTDAYLKASLPPAPSAWPAEDRLGVGARRDVIRALRLPPDAQLEKLIDLATAPAIPPEVRRVVVEVVGRRADKMPELVARIDAIAKRLAAPVSSTAGGMTRTDACLRRRLHPEEQARPGAAAECRSAPVKADDDLDADWIIPVSPWNVALPFPDDPLP